MRARARAHDTERETHRTPAPGIVSFSLLPFLLGTMIVKCLHDTTTTSDNGTGEHTQTNKKIVRVISTFNITPVYIVSQLGYIILQWCIIKFYTYFVLSKVNHIYSYSPSFHRVSFPESKRRFDRSFRAPIFTYHQGTHLACRKNQHVLRAHATSGTT